MRRVSSNERHWGKAVETRQAAQHGQNQARNSTEQGRAMLRQPEGISSEYMHARVKGDRVQGGRARAKLEVVHQQGHDAESERDAVGEVEVESGQRRVQAKRACCRGRGQRCKSGERWAKDG
ncbi:hypothetical protein FS749_002642 [Ceratobasidium sp. UAMH 11750]|nr:hypothetical protein FS749_002642 [Ceratobasidium sp. UAMH 11750]